MSPSVRTWLARCCFLIAAILLGWWLYVVIDARVYQERMGRRLHKSTGEATAHATRERARSTGLVGRIEIPRLDLAVVVVEGTTSRVLRRGVGHVEGTSFPGEQGNVGVAGHRDTYFRRLRNIGRGDLIRLRTPDGVFTYAVDSILIVKPSRGDLLDATDRPALTLVTCYPFYYVGPAPRRFVVRAHQESVRSASSGAPIGPGGTLAARSSH